MVAKVQSPEPPALPRHVAIIMDGNGRWAELQGLPRSSGHQRGIEPVRETVRVAAGLGIEALTLFAFSSENFSRPPEEISQLMTLFLKALESEIEELDRQGVRLTFVGDRNSLTPELIDATEQAEQRTAGNSGLLLVIAVAYGGRWDIVQAARGLAMAARDGQLNPDQIDEQRFAASLATASLPPVDLLIRTGGEQRVSNFLLWDLAYAELYFSGRLWPEFDRAELERAIAYFQRRERRFGRVAGQAQTAC
jgi:undecaprenyl diphosphate synthase